jgi:hypothetical protein
VEQFLNFIQDIIIKKDSKYKANSQLLKKCKEIDELIKKKFVFEDKPEIHEYKSYNNTSEIFY